MAGFDPLARPGAACSGYRRDRLTIPSDDQVIARTESTDEFHQLVGKVAGVDPSRVHSGPSGSARARDGFGTGAMRSRHDVGWFHNVVTEAIDGHVASPPERLSNSAISPKQSSARDRRLQIPAETGLATTSGRCAGTTTDAPAVVRARVISRPRPEYPSVTMAVLPGRRLDPVGSPRAGPVRLPATVGRAAIDAGASIVVGHGPHSDQHVEIYQGIPIFYSLGNLVFDWPAMQGRHLHGLLITTTFEDRVTITPTACDADNTARILTGAAAHGVLDAFVTLSAPLGARVRLDGDIAVLGPK